ncbi:MAG TPA: M50 family metallopeptidase [Acidimicrobiales bacterium]|nr:M50 family metallopeptidase [Acidimicrobiales bacterium]
MQDSIKLGRFGGVKVGLNWSFLALAGLIAYFLATSRLPAQVPGYTSSAYWVAGGLAAVALFAGVLIHEAAHAIAARTAKLQVDGITLWFMGGVTRIEGESRSPLGEFLIAFVGPLASGVIGGLSFGLAALAQAADWRLAAGALSWLGLINLLLGAFNLVPAAPLDGGRVLHGFIWWVSKNRWLATRITGMAGTVLGAACGFLGLLTFEQRDPIDGFVLLMMGWFVLAASKREQMAGRAQHVLGDVHISDIMRPAVIAPGWLTVGAFWNEWVNPYPDAAFLLERWAGGGWAGVVTAQQLASVPPGMHWTVRAQDVALALASAPDGEGALSPNLPALSIAGRAGAALPVKDHDAVVGVVLAPDIAAMVARGRPVPRRTWGNAVWPSPSPSLSQ